MIEPSKLLLGIDFETTGLEPVNSRIIEVGLALYESSRMTLVESDSFLIGGGAETPAEIVALTGLDHQLTDWHGVGFSEALVRLDEKIKRADYLVAHCADFEQKFLAAFAGDPGKPWIDTKTDLPYPPGKGSGTLNDIAMCHGIFNPRPHRAIFDVFTMMQLVAQYPFHEVERYAKAPIIELVVYFGYDAKKVELIKTLGGWRWDGDRKCWAQKCKEFKAQEIAAKASEAGFRVDWNYPPERLRQIESHTSETEEKDMWAQERRNPDPAEVPF